MTDAEFQRLLNLDKNFENYKRYILLRHRQKEFYNIDKKEIADAASKHWNHDGKIRDRLQASYVSRWNFFFQKPHTYI